MKYVLVKFRFLNNALIAERFFKVDGRQWRLGGAHTRFLHAWSLGSCVIAHAANKRAMPELIHNENCLLAESPEDIADLLYQARMDPDLRARIGRGGRKTLLEHFTPDVVGSKILAEMQTQVGERT